ncbi:MAG: hypothetical protein A2808_01865 [Candidatus Moranbacteria bacterium RIFCSPHIGHO2_01_FULL_55_24]|nr:MAG: hypothetical protein A2808_01865 [Candidatus Moranbacteria bacterium RIFCSPHIGHO2_01_FULL_55_24]
MKNIFLISGPSGSGQDSVIEGLAKRLPLERVITTTTRPMRPNESEGHPYYFVSREAFLQGIEEGKFLEHAEAYNHHLYGVTREELARIEETGKIALWKVEYQGAKTAKRLFPGIIAILVTAPLEVLEARIKRRDKPEASYIKERMDYTRTWFENTDIYDYIIQNQEGALESAVQELENIVRKHAEA